MMAEAVVFCFKKTSRLFVQCGYGVDLTIGISHYHSKNRRTYGAIIWDDTKPDGTPRKLMDVSKMHMGGNTKYN
jgi:GDP-L-fucose synthase